MNRIVVITGATSGIGKGLKEIFEKGDIVINISRSADPDAKNSYVCDVTDDDELAKVFKEIKDRFGRIDILINNAGYGISGAAELINIDEARHLFEVNFFAPLKAIQHTLPIMPGNGRIINISSACALFPLPFRSLYCASKASLLMLSEAVAIEVAKTGIKMTSICPGDVKTNFSRNRIKNFETNERYGKAVENSANFIDSKENFRMELEPVVQKIHRIIERRTYRPRYVIGAKYVALHILAKIFPRRVINFYIQKLFYKS